MVSPVHRGVPALRTDPHRLQHVRAVPARAAARGGARSAAVSWRCTSWPASAVACSRSLIGAPIASRRPARPARSSGCSRALYIVARQRNLQTSGIVLTIAREPGASRSRSRNIDWRGHVGGLISARGDRGDPRLRPAGTAARQLQAAGVGVVALVLAVGGLLAARHVNSTCEHDARIQVEHGGFCAHSTRTTARSARSSREHHRTGFGYSSYDSTQSRETRTRTRSSSCTCRRRAMTRDAVIVEAVRTPVGRRNGAYKDTHPVDLSAHILSPLAERTGIDPSVVDDVIWGCRRPGRRAGAERRPQRRRSAPAGPSRSPAPRVDRQCGSSQQAVHFAAAGVISGQYDVAVAGGVEVMTRVPMGSSIGTDVGFPFGPKVLRPLRRQAVQPGPRRRDDRRALGLSAASRSTSSPSTRTRRPPPRSTPARSPSSTPSSPAPASRPTRASAAADTLEKLGRPEDRVQGGRRHHRRQLLADLRRLAARCSSRPARRPPSSASSRWCGCTASRSPATTRSSC